ncbi:hypothetical protein JOS77_18265 [Chromobacterium haemolyticum]|nr:hypothetical protein JOS77_18265 [Chromobacterium haemolyticum]
MVDDQRQHRLLWAAAQQERAGQRAGAWVQLALDLFQRRAGGFVAVVC